MSGLLDSVVTLLVITDLRNWFAARKREASILKGLDWWSL